MAVIARRSPVEFPGRVAKSEVRGDWTVVLAYAEEGRGPWLTDLSPIPRWDLQDREIDRFAPAGKRVPGRPGECLFEDGVLIHRLNRTQAAVWHLGNPAARIPAAEAAYTDTTDATVCLALFGPQALAVVERLSALDFQDPRRRPPFLFQGPLAHVPCQLVLLRRGAGFAGGLVFTCARGYAESMVHALLSAGRELGLSPAGEERFVAWLAQGAV